MHELYAMSQVYQSDWAAVRSLVTGKLSCEPGFAIIPFMTMLKAIIVDALHHAAEPFCRHSFTLCIPRLDRKSVV